MQTIVTPELNLEPLLQPHAEAMFELLGGEAIYRYLDYPPPPSVEYLHDLYARLEARKSPDGSEVWLNWVIRPHGQPKISAQFVCLNVSGVECFGTTRRPSAFEVREYVHAIPGAK